LREIVGSLLGRIRAGQVSGLEDLAQHLAASPLWKGANLCPACYAGDHQNCGRILRQDNFCSTLGSIHVEYCECPVCRPSDPT
jgi:hypothetical protein